MNQIKKRFFGKSKHCEDNSDLVKRPIMKKQPKWPKLGGKQRNPEKMGKRRNPNSYTETRYQIWQYSTSLLGRYSSLQICLPCIWRSILLLFLFCSIHCSDFGQNYELRWYLGINDPCPLESMTFHKFVFVSVRLTLPKDKMRWGDKMRIYVQIHWR